MEHHPIAAALVLSLMAAQAPAQIIYTDIVPDQLCDTSGAHYELDLDNDGSMDFDIRYYKDPMMGCPGGACGGGLGKHPSWVRIYPVGTNAVDSTGTGYLLSAAGASALAPLQVIGAGPRWCDQSYEVLSNMYTHCSGGGFPVCLQTTYGPWSEVVSVDSSRYLGLRFSSAGATYYGWARVSIPLPVGPGFTIQSFTLKDYAYNSVPDELILAGDTTTSISTGIADILQRAVQVSPNPFSSTLSITINSEKPGAVLCAVRALTGEVLASWSLVRSNGRSSISRDLTSLAPGAYLLEVTVDGERSVRKVMKE